MIEQPDTSFESRKEISVDPFLHFIRIMTGSRTDSAATIRIKLQKFISHLVDCHDIGNIP